MTRSTQSKKTTRCHCANNVRGVLSAAGRRRAVRLCAGHQLFAALPILPGSGAAADRELCADLAATADTRKKCELCGKPFPARSNRAKYCDRCAPYAARRNAAERKRRQRAKARCVTV